MTLDPFAPIRLGLRLGIGVVRFELRLIEQLLGWDGETAAPPPPPPRPAPPAPTPRAPVVSEPYVEPTPPPVVPEGEAPPVPEREEPEHVDVEVELVGEFAEPGAEEGAGAEIHIDEPWDGYRKMRVADIRERVLIADTAEVAVVQLYESANRGRRSVLDAVERRTKELANAPR
jgi:hypothetical protein